jgi:uncharacterized protein (DUF433 family)
MVVDSEVMVPADRAAKLVGISRQRLYKWERSELIRPTVYKRYGRRSIVRLYDLGALTELKVAADIVAKIGKWKGVRQLRPLLERIGRHHEAPLRTLTWGIDERDKLHWDDGTGWQAEGPITGQFVLGGTVNVEKIERTLRKQLHPRRNSRAVGKIEKRRNVMASAPVFEGTRVRLTSVWEFLEDGEPLKEILSAYPDLREGDVRKAKLLRKAAQLAKSGASAADIRKQYPELTDVEVKRATELSHVA